ncbi:hypothetical protein ABMA75_10340 [Halobacteriovorax sp. ZH4_bin.1]|uniref:hypothetical protein n=1 Tax=unclassified Halobacteriovorax TaxID=2639665 RepID=UPI0037240189
MRKIILFVLLFNLNTLGENFTARGGGTSTTDWDLRTGSGTSTGDWKLSNVIELNSGVISGDDTLKLSSPGDFNFDSVNDRWILKTRGRILSVKTIELVDKYSVKQDEVTITKDNILNNYKRSIPKKMLERQLKRNVKFKNYIIGDFEY